MKVLNAAQNDDLFAVRSLTKLIHEKYYQNMKEIFRSMFALAKFYNFQEICIPDQLNEV